MSAAHLATVIGQGIKPKGARATCSVCGGVVEQTKVPAGGAWRHVKGGR